MANGNSTGFKMPGFMFGGGIALSNTALLVLGALGLGALYMHFDRTSKKFNSTKVIAAEMDPKNIENKIAADVMANAAQVDSVINNQDRIMEAVGRQKPRVKELRDNYRDGVISRDEYIGEIRAIWAQVAEELKIPIKNPQEIPFINRGRRLGQWRKMYGMNVPGLRQGWGATVSEFMPPATAPHVANHAQAGPVYSEQGRFLGYH